MRSMLRRLSPWAFLGLGMLLVFVFAGDAQEPTTQTPPPSTPTDVVPSTPSASPTARPATIKSTEKKPSPTILERVDSVFATAVEAMGEVLLYRLWQREETSIQFHHVEYFIRDPGSQGPFRAWPTSGEMPAEMTLADADLLLDQGRLAAGLNPETGKPRAFRTGEIIEGNSKREVEYVTRQLDVKSRYILKGDGKYHKLLPKRYLVSDAPADLLTAEQAATLASQGRLAMREPPKEPAADQTPLYLHKGRDPTTGVPLVVLWLATGAFGFTIYFQGFNFWGFRHALDVVRGRFDNPADSGEVTHFQALASALSATVGLGNIAGVTLAITAGGPGAFLWMMACGLFGMTSKFVECTLGQKYRLVKPDGTVQGGPMRYLDLGLTELGLKPLGVVLAFTFTIMCLLASFGGGNMFQANQSGQAMLALVQEGDRKQLESINEQIGEAIEKKDLAKLQTLRAEHRKQEEKLADFSKVFLPIFGVVMAVLVGFVIIGGIKRIGRAAEKIVPFMCGMYILACLWIIGSHLDRVPHMVSLIFSEALSASAFGGGLIGVAVIGIQRAAFSNEAGVGSASIAHSAAKTDEPIREGVVALMEPFIDTVVVCSMTALVILITDAWDNDKWVVNQGLNGAALTARAFKEEISWFPIILSIATVLFAYSTIISWSYYGERSWEQLFGARSTFIYKILAVVCVFIGSVVNLGAVLDFSDMMILAMAFPNVLGLALLAPKVKRDLNDYWTRYREGKFKVYK